MLDSISSSRLTTSSTSTSLSTPNSNNVTTPSQLYHHSTSFASQLQQLQAPSTKQPNLFHDINPSLNVVNTKKNLNKGNKTSTKSSDQSTSKSDLTPTTPNEANNPSSTSPVSNSSSSLMYSFVTFEGIGFSFFTLKQNWLRLIRNSHKQKKTTYSLHFMISILLRIKIVRM